MLLYTLRYNHGWCNCLINADVKHCTNKTLCIGYQHYYATFPQTHSTNSFTRLSLKHPLKNRDVCCYIFTLLPSYNFWRKSVSSKVMKSFVPELRSCKCFSCFGIPMFYVYMLWTFYVRFTFPYLVMVHKYY